MLAALTWIVLAAPVAPDATVLYLSPPGEASRLARVEAVRIQLADVAAVEEAQTHAGPLLGERVAGAADLVEQRGAVLAVWTEPAASEGELLLFAVSRHRERA